MDRENFTLADGRNLEFLRNGIDSDSYVILHAGTIQDISGWQIWLDYLASKGVAALAFGRSGYAASTKMPGRITIDVANDIAELADSINIKRMVNFGLSGGGQHAIACGLDPRSVGVVTSGSLAPLVEMGENFYIGMQQADLDEWADARRDINDLVTRFKGWMTQDAGDLLSMPEVSENDQKAQSTKSWKVLLDSVGYTMEKGFDWVADDYSSYLEPWGFDPRDVKVPVVIWQGGLDQNVPPQHGKWLGANLPNAKLHFIDDESHIGLFVNYEIQIMDSVIELLRG